MNRHFLFAYTLIFLIFCSGRGNIHFSNLDNINETLIDLDQNLDHLRESQNDIIRDKSEFDFNTLLNTKIQIQFLGFIYPNDTIKDLNSKIDSGQKVFDLSKASALAERGAIFRIDCNGEKVFTGSSDSNGLFNVNLTIPANLNKLCSIEITKGGFVTRKIEEVDLVKYDTINRSIAMLSVSESLANADTIDTDGDKIPDVYDAFPSDENRAFKSFGVNDSFLTIAFEDNFPRLGDGDYNDFIARYQVVQVRNADNQITDLLGFAEAVTKLAGYNHKFGLVINFPGKSGLLNVIGTDFSEQRIEKEKNVPIDSRADIVFFDSTKNSLKNVAGNNVGLTTEFSITFTSPISDENIDSLPFDPYLLVLNTGFDVHLLGKSPLPNSNNTVTDFRDANGYPRALLIPSDWKHPLERVHIETAYPEFKVWRESIGAESQDWFLTANSNSVAQSETTPVNPETFPSIDITNISGLETIDFNLNLSGSQNGCVKPNLGDDNKVEPYKWQDFAYCRAESSPFLTEAGLNYRSLIDTNAALDFIFEFKDFLRNKPNYIILSEIEKVNLIYELIN